MIKTRSYAKPLTGNKEADAVVQAIQEACLDLATDKKITQARLDEIKMESRPFCSHSHVIKGLRNLKEWIEISVNPITP